jgi:FkbM family methyltransferase
MSKPLIVRCLKIFICTGAVLIACELIQAAFPGTVLLFLTPRLARSPYCTVWQTSVDASIKVNQGIDTKRIRRASTLIQKDGPLELWETPYGRWWLPGGSPDILSILLAQQHRKIYGEAGAGGVRAGDIVLDCGAHVGTYVRTALNAGAKLVVAIEPSPEAVESLRRNMAREIAEKRVIVYPKGVWDKQEILTFYENGNGAAGDSFVTQAADAKKVQIAVTTIDKIAVELGLERIDFIKADVKGASERAVRGASEVIRRFHPRMAFSTEEAPEDPLSLTKLIQGIAPTYRERAGPCLFDTSEVRTDVMFYQ